MSASSQELLDNVMIESCVAKKMSCMSNSKKCVEYLSYHANGDATVADLSRSCDQLNRKFKISDAEELCQNLNDTHKNFWSRFVN
jgi:hypothetical protein